MDVAILATGGQAVRQAPAGAPNDAKKVLVIAILATEKGHLASKEFHRP